MAVFVMIHFVYCILKHNHNQWRLLTRKVYTIILISWKLGILLQYIHKYAMSDLLPFYFTLIIHLMAIWMVVSAIQFIGVACLMSHVILLLRPLKMRDWLLSEIKSIAVQKMNWTSECSPLATEAKDWGCLYFILGSVVIIQSYLAACDIK